MSSVVSASASITHCACAVKPLPCTLVSVRDLVRQNLRFFLLATAAGLLLRLFFVFRFPGISNDSLVYGDLAKNWLQHGVYGLTSPQGLIPVDIRLPGYPAFLALVFSIFGMEHYRAVLFVQVVIDLGTCFVIADLARRLSSPRAAKIAFLLAAACPFLADYSAAALTETLEIFFTAVAFDAVIAGLNRPKLFPWGVAGVATAAAILLRPDGGLILACVGFYLAWLVLHSLRPQTNVEVTDLRSISAGNDLSRSWKRGPSGPRKRQEKEWALAPAQLAKAGAIFALIALAPLLPWTLRNLRTMHELQPLAPRYANQPGEFVSMGFNRWVKTWIADFSSTEDTYWSVPGDNIDPAALPTRAFDSAEQREQTLKLIADYNQTQAIDASLDARFAQLAADRIHAHPLRYYVGLPLLRIADMWLRPRTEKLPSDTRWWHFDDDPRWLALALTLGVINLIYVGAALAGWIRNLRASSPILQPLYQLLVLFVLLRSLFLGTLENPEARYTLECYPVVIVFAAAFLSRRRPI